MIEYLKSLQLEYKNYSNFEEKLREFLNSHMDGDINQISLIDDIVCVSTSECIRGYNYEETYDIPIEYFKDAEIFVNNYMKFRR